MRAGVAQTRAVCGSAAVCAGLANALLVRAASGGLEPLLPQTGRNRRSALHRSHFRDRQPLELRAAFANGDYFHASVVSPRRLGRLLYKFPVFPKSNAKTSRIHSYSTSTERALAPCVIVIVPPHFGCCETH